MSKSKQYHKKTVQEYGKLYYDTHKEERKAWVTANREQIKERRRQYDKMAPPIVYAYFDAQGNAEYVGRGTKRRADQHKRSGSTWWTEQHTLLTMTCDSEWHAMEMEGKWGGRYLPKYNKEGYRHQNAG